MRVSIRPIGTSKGILLPKSLLVQAGLEGATEAELSVENGAIVLRRCVKAARVGWAAAARKVAEAGDELVMGEFGNQTDAELL